MSISKSLGRADAAWRLTLYPDAREAVCQFLPSLRPNRVYVPPGYAADPERSRIESARHAATQVRRYCAANGLDRLWTLTYRHPRCTELDRLVTDVGTFWRTLRSLLGGKPFPYLWVPEFHADGKHFHIHAGMGQYVHKSKIATAWPHGFVEARRLIVASSGADEGVERARLASRYLSKYVTKATVETVDFGRHRYEVAQGFMPRELLLQGTSEGELLTAACELMGRGPTEVWSSDSMPSWEATPTRTYRW